MKCSYKLRTSARRDLIYLRQQIDELITRDSLGTLNSNHSVIVPLIYQFVSHYIWCEHPSNSIFKKNK